MLLIKNAFVKTLEDKDYENGFVLCKDGKIIKTGDMSKCHKNFFDREDAKIIDAEGLCVYPGLIDPHSHIGMVEDGLAEEGEDVNEDTNPITPQLKASDGVYFMDGCFKEAREAGVTVCVTGPGSANVMGGTFTAIKTDNSDISNMILKDNVAMKFAFGQNPKFVYGDKKSVPATRMAAVSLIRETLNETAEYNRDKTAFEEDPDDNERPDYDIRKEALIPVIDGKIIVKSHAHRSDDIMSAVKLSKEYGYKLTVEHATEGHLIKDYLVKEHVDVICGPMISERCKTELRNHTVRTPGILANAGLKVAIMTDHPCVPVQYLALSAMIAAKNGMRRDDALRAITINAAELTGIADRVGSIKEGKDADLIITDGDILNFETNILYTVINGKIVYDRSKL